MYEFSGIIFSRPGEDCLLATGACPHDECFRAEEGKGNGTAGVLSHGESRRTLDLLSGSRAERRSHHPPAAWSSIIVAHVSAAADAACRQVPSGCARLSRLWPQ